MNVLVSGSTGFIGSALVKSLDDKGHLAVRLVRSIRSDTQLAVRWDPFVGRINASALNDLDAVVHLAGENISSDKWTEDKKDRILESRLQGTKLLAFTLSSLPKPPRVFLCASAVGFYGNSGDRILDEDSPPGSGFLADVARHWEAACEPARKKGIRVVNARLGTVLDPSGGILKKVLPFFRTGLGGKLGSGRQHMSWIALDDVVAAIHHVIKTDSVAGPVNFVAPNPVTNIEFTRTLADVLDRNVFLPAPAFALRLAFGEMADALLLSSTRAVPKKLIESGYSFKYEKLEDALRGMVETSKKSGHQV